MKLLITRPVVITGEGGVRSFAPGFTVDIDEPTAQSILAQQSGIPAEQIAQPEAPTHPRRRKPADAQT